MPMTRLTATLAVLALAAALPACGGDDDDGPAADASISADVGIGPIPGGFGIQVAMRISIPGWPKADVQALVDAAHKVCPYSNATRGNIDVTLTVV